MLLLLASLIFAGLQNGLGQHCVEVLPQAEQRELGAENAFVNPCCPPGLETSASIPALAGELGDMIKQESI